VSAAEHTVPCRVRLNAGADHGYCKCPCHATRREEDAPRGFYVWLLLGLTALYVGGLALTVWMSR